MSTELSLPSIPVSLFGRLQLREAGDWKRLFTLFAPVVYGWARRGGLQDSDAADVVQDVFAAVHAGIDRFEKNDTAGTFRGWLYGIARNKVMDHYRQASRRPDVEGGSTAYRRIQAIPVKVLPETIDPNDTESDIYLAQRGLAMIRVEFEPRTWQAFHSLAVEGRKAADVGAELGLSIGAVYVAKSRVLKRLREELQGLI
jgi:RNA polymerase sigma-70 factor (ECF subfamily)